MPSSELPRIVLVTLRHAIPFLAAHLHRALLALVHRLTYGPLPANASSPPPIIVIGASFAGHQAALRLAQTLPSPYRVLLIERRTHMHWVFGFPRFSVVPGYEACAMVPYEGGPLESGWTVPTGVLERVAGEVVEVRRGDVLVRRRKTNRGDVTQHEEEEEVILPFSALIIATGCEQDVPARLQSTDLEGACAELRTMQARVKHAQRVAVVGGGAVGVELASDIKDYYPDKSVTLVHSRTQLLNGFGERLHEHALSSLEGLDVQVVLGERPAISGVVGEEEEDDKMKEEKKKPVLTFTSTGQTEEFDLIIPCTGQRPNTALLTSLCPTSISPTTRRILVNAHLQILDAATGYTPHPRIFALGDVAETGAPKMARAAMMQAEVVVRNVLSLLKDGEKGVREEYKPKRELEGSIKLTLGIKQFAMWMREGENGRELLVSSGRGREDMGVAQAWSWYGPGAKAMPKRREVGV